MKRYQEIAFVAVVICMAALSATQVYAKDRHRGRNAAIGVLGAAAALAIISNSARANDRSDRADFDDEDADHQCRRWNHRCNDGEGWACRKFDRNC